MINITDRRYMRMKVLKSCTFSHGGDLMEGTLRDISLCGALVLTPRPVTTGERIQLDFSLPETPEPIHVNGKIVRLLADGGQLGSGFGVDFTVVSLSNREAIDNYVRSTFRYFRRLQFELSKFDIDWETVNEILQHTYLPPRTYSAEALRNLVTLELDSFRLRKVVSTSTTG